MRRIFAFPSLVITFLFLLSANINAQTCIPSGINGSVVNLSCSQTCTDFHFQVPHLKSTGTYVFNTIPYNPFPFIVAGGSEDPTIYADDKFGNKFTLPFPFCFYDSTFYKAVIGSNGLITFDTLNSGCSNAYTLANTIPYAGGTLCGGISPDYYPRSSIMGIFEDLDPRYDPGGLGIHCPADRKVQWRVEGTAPCRRFVVSFYHIGTFLDVCGAITDASGNIIDFDPAAMNTFQMVMYESTGLIDIFIENKNCNSTTNSPGYAIMGVQNWNQNQAVAAPGKNHSVWNADHEGFRFTPNGATSNFVSSELYTLGGTLVANADTSTTTPGLLDINFPNICPGATTQYVIKTVFNSCATAVQLIGYDTVTVVHINTLTAEADSTPSTCGASVGTITATVTGGTGTPPFTYTLNPGAVTNNTGVFTGLAAGTYTIDITDVVSCPVTITETVTSLSSLAGSGVPTGTTCTGVNNGTITLTPQGNPPYTFTMTGPGGPYVQSSPVFTNLPPGTFNVTYVDGSNCAGTISNITVTSGGTLTATPSHTNTSCAGASDGSITISPDLPGSYNFTLNPGAIANTTGIFTALAPNTYTVTFTNTATGCAGTSIVTVSVGGSITATWAHTQNETCPGANDGIITVTPNPASPGVYTFTMSPAPGGGATNGTGVFTGCVAGTFYNVNFTNTTTGCTGSLTFLFVLAATPVSGTQVHTNATCPGVDDGTITITAAPAGSYTFTLNPGAIVNTTGIFTGLAANTYSVSFANAGGCGSSVNNIPITVGAGATATAVTTNASCSTVSDGIITITPPAVGAPFVYTLNPGAVVQNNNPVFTGFPAGTYTITFTTASGCSGTLLSNPIINADPAPTATVAHTDATCTTSNDGTITVTPPAAGGPFVYTLNPGNIVQNNNPVFTGLAPAAYTITFTNAAGCNGTTTTNPTVSSGPDPVATALPANATCPGVNDGTITITPPAAGGPFIYTLNPGNVVHNNNPVYTGLASGTYTITFTTSLGCIGTINPTSVGANSSPTTTASSSNASCAGINDGTITVDIPSSGGPFIYTLNPGNIVQNSNPVFTGLATGTYTITFTNAAGCTGTVAPTNVGANASPTTTASSANASCTGINDGTITVNVPSSGGPFIYTLNPGNIVQNSNPVFTGLATGTYTITFTNAVGCIGTVPATTVGANASPTTTASSAATTCSALNDGTITVNVPLSGGPFIYTLNPGNIVQNNNPVFTGLAPGAYTVTFTNAVGCTGSVSPNPINVNIGADPTTSASTNPTTCPGANDGVITITAPATGAPFVYTLNPGNIVQNNNPVFTGLIPGTYTITFTNALGCNGTLSSNPVVQEGPALTANAPTITNPPCAGINDGILTIVPSLAGVYTYVLNPGLPTQVTQVNNATFTGLAPGTYNYNFTNASGCVGTGTATLTTHAPLAISVTPTQPLCYGNANGIITLSASGGLAAYEYALSPFTAFQTSGTFNGLAQGTYTFRVRDAAGCIKDTTLTLNQPTQLTASAVPTAGTCNGNDGQIVVTGNNGTPVYTYSIDGINFQSSNSFIVSGGPGTGAPFANITVQDNNGCLAIAPLVNVTLVDNMGALYIGNDTTICAEQHVTFQPQINPSATVFTWSTIPDPLLDSTLDNPGIKNPTATPLDTVTYVLNAQWGVCSRTDTMTINVLLKPIPDAGRDTAVCFDKTVAILHGNVSNVSGTVNYEWSDTAHLQTPHAMNTVAVPTTTETFTLTVTDNYGCNFAPQDVVVVVVQPPVPAFAGNDTIAVINEPHQLMATGGVAYTWTPDGPLNFSNIQNPLATLDHDQLFIVTVTDQAGCVGTDNVFVQVYPGPGYHVPTAFTPNGDGLNDIFRVVPAGIAFTDYFRIFNRYGEMVFQTNQWLKGWDGTFQGTKQPMGNYVWVLKGKDKNGKVIELKGTVLLIQ